MASTVFAVQPAAKSIFATKTFWANVLGAGAQIVNAGALHAVNPVVGIVAQGALNIGIRLLTNEPASLTGK